MRISDKPMTPRHAWQPFTPRGIAAFAYASNNRLIIVQLLIAIAFAFVCLWFIRSQWMPVVEAGMAVVPEGTSITRGQLLTPHSNALVLGGNKRLELVFDPSGKGVVGGTADVIVTLSQRELRVCGILGCLTVPYDPRYTISLGRADLAAWWGAWRTPIHILFVSGITLHLLVLWWAVAFCAAPVLKLITLYADRVISWAGSWRLANAALLPGTMIVMVGIALYDLDAIDLMRMALIYLVHLLCGIAFLGTSPFFLPKVRGTAARKDPFGGADKSRAKRKKDELSNPFGGNEKT